MYKKTLSNFKHDLILGQFYEKEALNYIKYEKFKLSEGKFKPYDIKVWYNGKKTRYEIKSDRLGYKTGNVAIEYKCNNIDSGINSTRAKYYIYFIIKKNCYDAYKIKTKVLKKLVENCRKVKGGDGCRSHMYLLKLNLLEEYLIASNVKI